MKNFIFIPGNDPKMIYSADYLGSDASVLDLEDAVAINEKTAARILVRTALDSIPFKTPIGIRINPVDSPYWKYDLSEILKTKFDFMILPKVNSPNDIHKLLDEAYSISSEKSNNLKIVALLETPLGIESAYQIACCDSHVTALFLGAEDLTAELFCERSKEGIEILYARSKLIYAARAAGINVYDTPFADLQDMDSFEKDAKFAHKLGFDGKAAIHPKQIPIINKIWKPSCQEIIEATEILNKYKAANIEGDGVLSINGKMIDTPVVKRATYILKNAGKAFK